MTMTFEKCHATLAAIRRKQGTRTPLIRVDYGGTVYEGRVARSDSDPENNHGNIRPFGLLVLEPPGLVRMPETVLQIAGIPDDGLRSVDG
jgi:hypothetical protein